MKRAGLLAALLAASLLPAVLSQAQLPKPENVVQVRVEPAEVKAKAGAVAAVTLIATVQDGFHINSHKPVQDYLIPTRVELLEVGPLVVLDTVDYPAGELKTFGFAPDEKLSVYEGTLKLPVRLRIKPGVPAGLHAVRLAFHFQACNDQLCLRPARRDATLQVRLQ